MTMHDDLLTTHPDLRNMGSTLEPPPPPSRRGRRWMLVTAIGSVALVAVGAGAWWALDTRVPASDYDAVVADLETARSDLLDAENAAASELSALDDEVSELTDEVTELGDETESLRQQLAYSRARVDELTATNNDLRTRMGTATSLAEILVYWELSIGPEYYQALIDQGVDFTAYDELLARFGDDVSAEEWVASEQGWFRLNGAVLATRDDELIDAWVRYNDTPVGSDEEAIALSDFFARFETLLYDSVAGSQEVGGADGDQVAISRNG